MNIFRKKSPQERQENREAYGRIMHLALPIIIQNLFSAAISSADVVMLNIVGQSAISAVSLATQYSGILLMVFYGLGTGETMLCAQYWGKGDLNAIRKVEGIALRFALGMAAVSCLFSVAAPGLMMRLFTNDTELIALGAQYLRIVGIGWLFWGISEVYLSVLRSVERVRISTILNVSALLLNIFLNALFVLGWFGLPRLGVRGVALATMLSRAAELVGCFLVSAFSDNVKLQLRLMFVKSGILMQDFIRLALPALGNDIIWSVGFSMYSVVMGHLGTDVVAANALVSVVRNLGTVFCFAIGSASCILVGKEIGASRMEEARADAGRSMVLTVIAGAIGGMIVALLMPVVVRMVSISETARGYLRIMLLINTYYIMGSAVNTTLIAGIFRAGGDSRFGFICDTIDMWCYGVPLGFFTAFVLKLPPMWVYFLLCTDEFVKWPWVLSHYRSEKWLKNITRELTD